MAAEKERKRIALSYIQRTENETNFQNYTRLPVNLFDSLLRKITQIIEKEDTILRDSISPGARLEATLLFLNSGCSYTSLQYSTRISKSALSSIIIETCEAIYTVLKDDYLKVGKINNFSLFIFFINTSTQNISSGTKYCVYKNNRMTHFLV